MKQQNQTEIVMTNAIEKTVPDLFPPTDDEICIACDGEGLVNEQLCKVCQGSGRIPYEDRSGKSGGTTS